jgi:hypothetical protein
VRPAVSQVAWSRVNLILAAYRVQTGVIPNISNKVAHLVAAFGRFHARFPDQLRRTVR